MNFWRRHCRPKAELFAQFYTKIFTVESDDGPMIEMHSEADCEEIGSFTAVY